MNDSREDLKTMDEPGSEDLISGDVNGRADINQNDADVTSMEVSSRKMLRNGDSEDDLVENGKKEGKSLIIKENLYKNE